MTPVRIAEPLTADPKAKGEREAEQGVQLSRPGPLSALFETGEADVDEQEPVQATKECRRCGQIMPADCEPDGCEDFYCPEAK